MAGMRTADGERFLVHLRVLRLHSPIGYSAPPIPNGAAPELTKAMRRNTRTIRPTTRIISACLLMLALSGCISTVKPESFSGNQPEFLPEKFFAGNTRGSGILQASDGTPSKQISVTSNGRMLPDGRFQLEQTISQSIPGSTNVEKTTRTWVITKVGSKNYTATLTDAAGPVTAEVHGNLFHLKYLFRKPFVTMEQWLYLQADGRTVLNEARISLPGSTIARISEIIVRQEE